MNSPIIRLYGLLLLFFAALVGFTSYWAVFDADNLKDNPENRRPLIAEQTVERGIIETADGVTVAESFPVGGGKNPVYVREYPQGKLFGNPVGYSFIEAGRTGIERFENGFLAGERNEFASIIDQIRDVPQEGDDVALTIDAQTQGLATQALESAIASTAGASGAGGSVVAIEPSTGAVRVMASVPGFDPNLVKNTDTLEELNTDQSAPLVNRPTQSTYEPGSTMKVVTAAAALDSGEFTPDTVLSGASPQEIGGVDLQNAGDQSFGDITATDALTNSVNTYWAQVGERLGNETMFKYMDRFGFNRDPELGYPDSQMAPSGIYDEGQLLDPGDAIDIGRAAIGQERLLTTPLQMAEVAATIANQGVLMRPTFVQRVTDPDGRTVEKLDPHEQSTVVSEESASQVAEMMTNVTEEGTAAGLTVGGLPFAGKTGTAEIDPEAGINRPWFIGFAPADDPQVAVAVMLERCQSCFGGDIAGPIATQVMESLLNR
ncbi:MAG: penicillin-binding protein 2 [Actinomycetota bacterium]